MRKLRFTAAVAAVALVAASCGGSDSDTTTASEAPAASEAPEAPATDAPEAPATEAPAEEAPATEAPADDTVQATQAGDIEIAVITHSDGGVFWSVFEKGAADAGKALGVTVRIEQGNNDGAKQAAAINQAVADGVDGLAVSLADPDALQDAVASAVDAGIPLVTTNSGSNLYKDFGAFTHIGQDEFQAGQGAGEKFNEAGATKVLCAKQEQTNVGLDARCEGLIDTFEGEVVAEFVELDQDLAKQQAALKAKLDADPAFDGVFGTGPNIAHSAAGAAAELGREITIGGVDLSEALLDDIESGAVAFTIDQQQYLQGYISVVSLFLNITNANTLGGGLPIATGPGFVTKDNASAVKELVAAGTR
jgi:simple sugar transport system substrate-binding protein